MSKSIKIDKAENGFVLVVTETSDIGASVTTLIAYDIHEVAERLVQQYVNRNALGVEVTETVDGQQVKVRTGSDW